MPPRTNHPQPQRPRRPPPPRRQQQQQQQQRDASHADAIHRALLTGLLGNAGYKSGDYEYTGARGRKFYIFPGSALFKRNPKWVVAAELVETTRLYARTVAPIDPRWVEHVAGHLVKREYFEPHWLRERADVIAYERVTLYGMPVVHRRPVRFGLVDPKTARDIFIPGALVDQDYDTDAQYFRHNRDLVREIELIEAKLRRRDVLVDAKARFAFYDSRIPQGVFNGFLFERWRREAEQKDKRLLFMTRPDLMLHAAEAANPGQFPDALNVGPLRLRLDYRLDPGHPADGVTATVPLAALNQLPPEPFEWLVPGMLKEKVTALIRTLPKPLRVQFVPVPEVADAVTPELTPYGGSLYDALALQLGRRIGNPVPRDAFQPDTLPDHLRMNFRVVDDAGNQVATGRDLADIRQRLGIKAREAFAAAPAGEFHRDGLARWDFGDLPPRVEVKRHGQTLQGFPALVDRGNSLSLRLLDTAAAAEHAMRAGLRRLFMLQLREEFKWLSRKLPGVEPMCLHYATVAPCDDLKTDLLAATADRALFGDDLADDADAATVRTQPAFAARAAAGWRGLSAAAREVTDLVGLVLAQYNDLTQRLDGPFAPMLHESVRDMRSQLAYLVRKGFVTAAPFAWLRQYPRFLKGVQVRLHRLMNAGLARDAAAMAEVAPLWNNYLRRAEEHRRKGVHDPALEQYRWMVEELRVSLFAQELKTSIPVSVKRVQQQWTLVQPG